MNIEEIIIDNLNNLIIIIELDNILNNQGNVDYVKRALMELKAMGSTITSIKGKEW